MVRGIPKIAFRNEPEGSGVGFELVDLKRVQENGLRDATHNPFEPHKIDFFAIVVLDKGQVQHQVDFDRFTLRKGEALLIAKGQVQAFDPESIYNGYMIVFTEGFLLTNLAKSTLAKVSRLYNYHLGSPLFKMDEPDNDHLLFWLKRELQAPSDYGRSNILASILAIYLLKLERIHKNIAAVGNMDRRYTLFEQFRTAVQERYHETRNARDYARDLAVSYKVLNEACKLIAFKTAKEFIDQHVILESKRYLTTTALTVKEIAYRSGFDEPTNFLKYFKKLSGKTPLQFRKSMQTR